MRTEVEIEVMQAYVDGKTIQYMERDPYHPNETWKDWEIGLEPSWNWEEYIYKVKEEPKNRKYKDTDEMVADFKNRFKTADIPNHCMPLIWVKNKVSNRAYLITSYGIHYVVYGGGQTTLEELFKNCTYLDGSPIGKLVE